ncbi:MAG TPA: hypothetical protein VFA62_11975 [Acidimicrobiia bacterium]|nr:hypothetical protein [Acidimicrobiia bacterium]
MSRRVRRLAVVVLVLLVIGAIALVLTTRPKLEDSRHAVDRAWTPVRGPLSERYDRLAAVNEQLAAAGGGERDVARALGLRLARWGELRRARTGDANAEAETADQLEGLATRLQAVVSSSDRLRSADGLNQSIAAFQGTSTQPLLAAVKTYNDSVRHYEDERNGLLRSPVASLFGYDSRPQLLLSS